MAGRPKRAALVKAVTEAGGEDALITRIEAGETVAAIAGSLDVSRPMLSSFLNRSSDSKERIARARETASHALVEEALVIADSATHEDDRAKRLQVQTRQWLAGKYNRDTYGEHPPQTAVAAGFAAIFLAGLKKANEVRQEQQATESNCPPRRLPSVDTDGKECRVLIGADSGDGAG